MFKLDIYSFDYLGAPHLIFSLSDVWRSCRNYHSMDYSTETAAKLIICGTPRQYYLFLFVLKEELINNTI